MKDEFDPVLKELGFKLEDGRLTATGLSLTRVLLVRQRALIVVEPGDLRIVEGVKEIALTDMTIGDVYVVDFSQFAATPVPETAAVSKPEVPRRSVFARPSPRGESGGTGISPSVSVKSVFSMGSSPLSENELDPRLQALGFTRDGTVLRAQVLNDLPVRVRDGGLEIELPGGDKVFVAGVRLETEEVNTSVPGSVGFDM